MGKDNPLTCLVTNLDGIDPDSGTTFVAYEKGHTFLWFLEEVVGGPGIL